MSAEIDVHDLPEAASTDRRHRLERDCWCEPEVIEQNGRIYVVHHHMQEVLAAHADTPEPR